MNVRIAWLAAFCVLGMLQQTQEQHGQGIPVQQGGTVTGVLRDAEGKPVPGIRMAAVARPDSSEDAAGGAAMAGLAQTDEQGRYTLENVPPGRYYIAAGRLDLQTYFPGTQIIAEATAVTILPGATLAGMDFILNNTSFGRSTSGAIFGAGGISASVPLQIKVENGGKLPVSANGSFITVLLQSANLNLSMPIGNGAIAIPGPVTADFQVTVQNLPDTYVVKSITYGSTDITRGTFRLTPANFTPTGSSAILNTPQFNASEAEYRVRLAAAAAYLAATATSTITITLTAVSPPGGEGVRVSGETGHATRRLIFISGTPGVLFSDWTFEFRGVPPGRHVIATENSPGPPMAVVVVVGDTNVEGIKLQETQLLPANIRTPSGPLPAGRHKPGTIVPLARVTGTVSEEVTRARISEGSVMISAGNYSRSFPIDTNGQFEAFHLLPGTYDLKLQIFGHSSSNRTIVVDDKDLNLELTSLRMY